MATLMHILAHPEPHGSSTTRISDTFLASYQGAHLEDEIVTVDLYHESPPFLTDDHLAGIFNYKRVEMLTPATRQAWEEIERWLVPFMAADKYLVTAPMWNFGVPAILKAYIDLIVVSGKTFRYLGPGVSEGLLTGKRMVIISTRGGIFSEAPYADKEMCVRYIETIFSFLGVEVVDTIIAEGLALVPPDEQDQIIREAMLRARTVGTHL